MSGAGSVMSNAHDISHLGKKASTTEDQTLGGSGALHRRWSLRMAMRDAASAAEGASAAIVHRPHVVGKDMLHGTQLIPPKKKVDAGVG